MKAELPTSRYTEPLDCALVHVHRHWHGVGERDRSPTFHDAFEGSYLLVSDQIPEENIRAFTSILGAAHQREPNVNKRDPEQLRRFLWALENPHKLRMNWP